VINITWKDEIKKAPSKKIERLGAEYLKGVNSDVFEKNVLNEIESLKEGLEYHIEKLEGITDWNIEEDEDIADSIVSSYKLIIRDLEKMMVSVKKIAKKLEEDEDDYEDLFHEDMVEYRKNNPHYIKGD
jgi:hypothetical protein